MKPYYLLCLLALLFTSCEDDDDPFATINADVPDNVEGLNFVEYDDGDFALLYDSMMLGYRDYIFLLDLMAETDHQQNATSVGLTIPPTHLTMVRNMVLNGEILLDNQLAALDLPHRVLAYVADDDDVVMAFTNSDYLRQRYGINGTPDLLQMDTLLQNMVTLNGQESIHTEDANDITYLEGIIIKTSAFSVDETFAKLTDAINNNADLNLMAEVDFMHDASLVFRVIPPTRLAIFGNPKLGTPLMQDERSIGIDLPQKMLIYEDANGTVRVAYNDIHFLADRHDVDDDLPEINMIATALDALSTAITTE